MKSYFNIFFSILFSCYLYPISATELKNTNTPEIKISQKFYQLDIIVFYYTDLALENMTSRILPLNKDFTGNKIIGLDNVNHPLTKILSTDTTNIITTNKPEENHNKTASLAVAEPDALLTNVTVHEESSLPSPVAISDEVLVDQDILALPMITANEASNSSNTETTKTNVEYNPINFVNNENIDNPNYYLTPKNTTANLSLEQPSIKQDLTILDTDNTINNNFNNNTIIEDSNTVISIADTKLNANMQAIQNEQNAAIEKILLTVPFIELPETHYLLKDEFKKISTNENVKLILYNCWRMPIDNTKKVILESTTNSNFKQLKAEIFCKKNNLGKILITTDLYFNLSTAELKQLNKNNKILEYKKKHKHYDPYLYNFFSYEFKTSIKNSDKLIYLDSSVIGILIKLTPIP